MSSMMARRAMTSSFGSGGLAPVGRAKMRAIIDQHLAGGRWPGDVQAWIRAETAKGQ
jgi:hypothetical protein